MAETVELWLVRHGETAWSVSGQHTSFTDIPLTEHGRERAKELRDYLAGRKFAAVLVSPWKRAMETCAIAGYGDVAEVDDDLQEWNYGEAEGKTTPEMRTKYGADWSVWTNALVGGESVDAVGVRADRVIARAVELARASEEVQPGSESPDPGHPAVRQVALFAHAHILRILAARWLGLPAVDGKMFALGTGSVSVLGHERETRGWW